MGMVKEFTDLLQDKVPATSVSNAAVVIQELESCHTAHVRLPCRKDVKRNIKKNEKHLVEREACRAASSACAAILGCKLQSVFMLTLFFIHNYHQTCVCISALLFPSLFLSLTDLSGVLYLWRSALGGNIVFSPPTWVDLEIWLPGEGVADGWQGILPIKL